MVKPGNSNGFCTWDTMLVFLSTIECRVKRNSPLIYTGRRGAFHPPPPPHQSLSWPIAVASFWISKKNAFAFDACAFDGVAGCYLPFHPSTESLAPCFWFHRGCYGRRRQIRQVKATFINGFIIRGLNSLGFIYRVKPKFATLVVLCWCCCIEKNITSGPQSWGWP